jgi:hypothetical protein
MLARMAAVRDVAWLALLGVLGCALHAEAPPRSPRGAATGHAPPGFDTRRACADWRAATSDGDAREHDSFPELDTRASCFVPVRHERGGASAGGVPPGCGYPRGPSTIAALSAAAERNERIARGEASEPLPIELACKLPDRARRAAAAANARTLRATIERTRGRAPYPYAAVSTFGYGNAQQNASVLASYLPGDACPKLDKEGMMLLGVNVARAGRAAEAWLGGVAPIVTVSGGAVHAKVVEAFMLRALLACRFGVPETAVLLDPCADHTHTNIRNTGALVRAIGGRTAYLVTDDGLQSAYLEEWTSFDLIGGSVDQRSLRDFGYLLGSWRRASVGMKAGFWYTPYRFWAEPEAELGGFTCVAR